MNAEVKAIANHPIMWVITIFALAIIFVQAIIYLRKSLTASKEMGIPEERLKSAAKASAISCIGPSLVIAFHPADSAGHCWCTYRTDASELHW